MMQAKENPRWVDKALAQSMDEVLDVASSNSLPKPIGGPRYEELGCGHYGCVLETEDESVVFKLTSDPTEAMFIGRTLDEQAKFDEDPYWGMVIYYAYIGLDFTYRRRPVYAIWREAAFKVGDLGETLPPRHRPDYDDIERAESLANLKLFQDGAFLIREKLEGARDGRRTLEQASTPGAARRAQDIVGEHFTEQQELFRNLMLGRMSIDRSKLDHFRRRYTGYQAVAVGMELCFQAAMTMDTSDRYLSAVGNTMMHYVEKQIYLADVHAGNIGQVARYHDIDEDRSETIWAITDPGHAIFLDDFLR